MRVSKLIQKIDVFISSPGDVSQDREIAKRVIERINRLPFIRDRYYLRLLAYEHDVPPVVGTTPQTIVDEYMLKAEHSDLLICVMWMRMGTPVIHPQTGEHFPSGTLYEFISAYRANQRQGKPYILLYKKTQANPNADPEQAAKVVAFFKRFEGMQAEFKGLYQRYDTPEMFEQLLFEHILQVIAKNLIAADRGDLIDAYQRPDIVEEERRLDAAMPTQTKIGRPTEVWVQICLPTSAGFRNTLPQFTKSKEEIAAKDVRAGSLAVAFPIDRRTGKPLPIQVRVELAAPDFDIEKSYQAVMLSPKSDTGLLTFGLTPTQARSRSIVHVAVKQTMPDGTEITLGSAALATQIAGAGFQIAGQIIWTVLSLPLAAAAANITKTKSERASAESELFDSIILPEGAKPAAPIPTPPPTPTSQPAASAAGEDLLGGMDPLAWLESLAERQGAKAEELTTVANLDVPLPPPGTGIDEPGYTPGYDTGKPAPASSTSMSFPSASEPQPAAKASPAEEDAWTVAFDEEHIGLEVVAPDWYVEARKRFEEENEVPSEAEEEPLPTLSEPEPAAPAGLPDWLREQRPVPSEASAAELPDWLSQPVSEEPELAPAAEAELPDWLREQSEVRAEAEALPGEIPDWLHSLGAEMPAEEAAVIPAGEAAAPVPAEVVPAVDDWTADVPEAMPVDLPDWLRPEVPVPAEMTVAEPLPPVAEPVVERAPAPPLAPVKPVVVEPVPPKREPVRPVLPPPTGDVMGLLQKARELVASEQHEQGLQHYQALIDSAQLLEETRGDLRQLIQQNPSNPRLHRLLGDTYMRLDDLQEALDCYRKALIQL